MDKTLERAFQDTAKRLYHAEGEVEVDEHAKVSWPSQRCPRFSKAKPEGAYVQAWVWVPIEEVSAEPLTEEN